MQSLIRFFVAHRTAANLVMAAMILSGLAAAGQIRAQFFPDIDVETITVRATWDGAGPSDVDAGVIEALEPALLEIDGVEQVRSTAREGVAAIQLEFEPGVDLGAAADEVQAAVDAVSSLPDEIDDIDVERGRYRDRVTNIIVAGPVGRPLLERYAEELRSVLFRSGVTRVAIQGAPQPEIRIEPTRAALERYGLTFADIAGAVGAEVDSRPAGAIGEAGARIRAGDARQSAEALETVVIRSLADGAKLRLRDVAEVREAEQAGAVAFFKDGAPAIQLRVDRTATGDAIRLQAQVEAVVAAFAPTLPAGVTVELTRTRSQYIQDRLNVLLDNAAWGLAIVLALLFLFLSARTAFWVAAGIPASLLATIALMWATGISLNIVSLFALIVALGIVVDDAIVVGERADRLGRDGLPPAEAAARAARQMAAPVFSASITTIIAFAGLIAVGGRFGALIIDLPLTLIAVLTASLIEAFIVLPAHMRHAIAAQAKASWIDWPSRQVNRGLDAVSEHVVRPALKLALRLRYVVLAGAVGLLAFSASLLIDGTVPWRFFVGPERGTVTTNIAMKIGATREDTFDMLEELRRALDVIDARFAEEYGVAPVVSSLAKIGGTVGRGLSGADSIEPDRLGGFEIEMVDPDQRPFTQAAFLAAWRAEIRESPALDRIAARGGRGGPAGDAIEVELYGARDARVLKAAAEETQAALAELPGVSALEDSLPYDKPELVLTLTPLGEALGFTTEAIGAALRARLEGVTAARFALEGDEIEVRVAFDEATLNPAFLDTVRLRPPAGSGAGAPLVDLVEIRAEQGFASVRRIDGRRVVQINGDMDDDPALRDAATRALETEILPRIAGQYGVEYRIAGVREQERAFLSDAALGAVACLAGIYATLAWIFASWTRPIAVLLVIPFGLIGALWGHHWHDQPLSMFSIIGLLGMAGIIINDSIVLTTSVDAAAKRRPIFEAALDGALGRLRAVLLTTLTTVGGLTPLLFEESRQAQFLMPTVITLVYGLGFGMVLVLLVTPALILVQRDVAMSIASARRLASHWRRPRPALGPPRRAVGSRAAISNFERRPQSQPSP